MTQILRIYPVLPPQSKMSPQLMDLIYACDTPEALSLIESENYDCNYIDDNDGCTLLICACDNCLEAVALALIKKGNYQPDHIDKYQRTAIFYAMDANMYQVVYILLTNDIENSEAKCINPTFRKLLYKNFDFIDTLSLGYSDFINDLHKILAAAE